MTPKIQSPKAYALRLLNFRDRSEKEIREKLLQKGYAEAETEETLEYLKGAGFVDDSKLARNLLIYLDSSKKMGLRRVTDTLKRRGIPESIIEETLREVMGDLQDELSYGYSIEGEIKKAKILIQKKEESSLKNYPLRVKLNRLYGILNRRGFGAETIKHVLKEVT
ncbi:MAG: regulatory protein RecX [Nitrospirae bacterium]|nr:regulatory protein RecX [Nitrospirota bacterium]MBF0535585.1 regulatory protein RecX [Nitrospirota bacterium]MBF0617468.1 regulatory protein RecX [Nitrospirota bacterium]